MAKKYNKSSGVAPFGFVVIVIAIIVGANNSYLGLYGVTLGVLILLFGIVTSRLDIIIDLLCQVIEHQPETEEEKKARLEEEK